MDWTIFSWNWNTLIKMKIDLTIFCVKLKHEKSLVDLTFFSWNQNWQTNVFLFMNLKILFFLWNQNALKKAKLVTLLYSTRIYICGDVLNFGSIIKRSSTSPVVMSILIILHKEDRSSSEYDWLMAIVNMSNEPSLSWLVMSWGIFKHATDKNGLGGSLISSCK